MFGYVRSRNPCILCEIDLIRLLAFVRMRSSFLLNWLFSFNVNQLEMTVSVACINLPFHYWSDKPHYLEVHFLFWLESNTCSKWSLEWTEERWLWIWIWFINLVWHRTQCFFHIIVSFMLHSTNGIYAWPTL